MVITSAHLNAYAHTPTHKRTDTYTSFIVQVIGICSMIARIGFSTTLSSSFRICQITVVEQVSVSKGKMFQGLVLDALWFLIVKVLDDVRTSVRIPSARMCCRTRSSARNVCATEAGSARPIISMITPSNGFPGFPGFLEISMNFAWPAMRS